jgi:hypothetical protein
MNQPPTDVTRPPSEPIVTVAQVAATAYELSTAISQQDQLGIHTCLSETERTAANRSVRRTTPGWSDVAFGIRPSQSAPGAGYERSGANSPARLWSWSSLWRACLVPSTSTAKHRGRPSLMPRGTRPCARAITGPLVDHKGTFAVRPTFDASGGFVNVGATARRCDVKRARRLSTEHQPIEIGPPDDQRRGCGCRVCGVASWCPWQCSSSRRDVLLRYSGIGAGE